MRATNNQFKSDLRSNITMQRRRNPPVDPMPRERNLRKVFNSIESVRKPINYNLLKGKLPQPTIYDPNRFTGKERIGEGAYGEVHKAFDEHTR